MSRRGAILQDYGGAFPTQPQDAQLAAASYYQRDKELAAKQSQHDKSQKAKNGEDIASYIEGVKGEHVGDITPDALIDKSVMDIRDEMAKMKKEGKTLEEIKMYGNQVLPKLDANSRILKNGFKNIDLSVAELSKEYPTGDATKAKRVMINSFLDKALVKDDKGKIIGNQDPSLIPDIDFRKEVLNPDNVEKWYPQGNSSLVKNIQDTRGLSNIKGTAKFTDSTGGYKKKAYAGQISIYDKPTVDDEGQMTGFDLDREVVTLGVDKDGRPNIVEVMPKKKFEVLRGNGASALEFDMAVNKHIQQDLGINPKSLDPAAKDIYERQYALNFLKESSLAGSQYNPMDEVKTAPIKNITNVRVGSDAKDVPSIDVYTPLRQKMDSPDRIAIRTDEGTTVKIVPANFMTDEELGVLLPKAKLQGGEDVNVANMYIRDIAGKLYMFKAANNGKVSEKKDTNLGEVTKGGANVTANQPLGQKSKVKAATEAKETGNAKGKTFNIIDPSTGKVVMSNVDQSAADKAKSKGYKIQ